MVLDYEGCLPCYAWIPDGKQHDSKVAKTLVFPKGSVVLCDRGYLDFSWLRNLDSSGVVFVIRAKDNMAFEVKTSCEVDKESGFQADQNIRLIGPENAQA